MMQDSVTGPDRTRLPAYWSATSRTICKFKKNVTFRAIIEALFSVTFWSTFRQIDWPRVGLSANRSDTVHLQLRSSSGRFGHYNRHFYSLTDLLTYLFT